MGHLALAAIGSALLVGWASAAHAEPPTFEINGFPLTRHQVIAVDTGLIRESMPGAATVQGMPASPHQIAVLTPRAWMSQQQIATKLNEDGYSRVRFLVPVTYRVMGFRDGAWVKLTVDGATGELR